MAHPKIIIGIQTHPPELKTGRIAAVRETWCAQWLPTANLDYRFFFDQTHKDPAPDEIIVGAPTSMLYMPWKTHKVAQWVLEHGYDYLFYVPTDCYVCVPRLLVSGFEATAYAGFRAYDEPHIGGGSGYWLSRRSLEAVASYEPYADYEDRWVGTACRASGIDPHHDARYWSNEQPWLPGIITAHLSVGAQARYEPVWMRAYHKYYLEHGVITRLPVQE